MRLRGHHLICLHFYHGQGYELAFIDNLCGLTKRAKAGEPVEVVAGPDDVCRSCPYLEGLRCNHQEGSEVEIQRLDEMALAYLELQPGQKRTWQHLEKRAALIPQEWFLSFCEGCSWAEICKVMR